MVHADVDCVRSFIAKVFARFYAVLENLEENAYRRLIWRWTDDTWRNTMGVLRVLMSSELCSRKTKTIRLLEGTNWTVLRFIPTWSVWNILNHFIFLFFFFINFLWHKLCRHCWINNIILNIYCSMSLDLNNGFFFFFFTNFLIN